MHQLLDTHIKNKATKLTHLLPELWLQGQTRAGCNKPAVSHNSLVQIMGADALNKQMRFFTYLLQQRK